MQTERTDIISAVILGACLIVVGLFALVSNGSLPNATNNSKEMLLGDNWDCGLISYPANTTKAIEIMKYCTGGEKEVQ